MPKTRFFAWYRLIPLAAVFAFGLSHSFTRVLPRLSLSRCIPLTTRRM